MGILFIKQITAYAVIGTHAWERKVKQKVCVDIETDINSKQIASQDTLQHGLDYAHLVEQVTEFISNSTCSLIETLAEQLADKIYNDYSLSWLKLTLSKPLAIQNAQNVGIVVERMRA